MGHWKNYCKTHCWRLLVQVLEFSSTRLTPSFLLVSQCGKKSQDAWIPVVCDMDLCLPMQMIWFFFVFHFHWIYPLEIWFIYAFHSSLQWQTAFRWSWSKMVMNLGKYSQWSRDWRDLVLYLLFHRGYLALFGEILVIKTQKKKCLWEALGFLVPPFFSFTINLSHMCYHSICSYVLIFLLFCS